MSRPLPSNGLLPLPDPAVQVCAFANMFRAQVNPDVQARLLARVRELGLCFSEDELTILAALNTPDKVHEFLNTQIYYNYDHPTLDHAAPDTDKTSMPPRKVLQTGRAHCFEGACFAYAVDYLHGHDPRWVLLESSQDSDHNLILYRDPATGLYGVNAHSGYPKLIGQPARFTSIRDIAEYYFPYYYSDHTLDPNDVTLVGYSEPIDLVAKYGTAWMASDEMLWDIYYTYIDDTVRLHYMFDDTDQTHLYPQMRALREGWIQVDAMGQPVLRIDQLAPAAQELWHSFWKAFDRAEVRARGEARVLEMSFFALTGTTPLDLETNVDELASFLGHGYRIDQLITHSGG